MWREAMMGRRRRRYLLERAEQAGGCGAGGEQSRSRDWLYESYYCMSQQHPLIVFLLLIVMGACLALLAVFFASGLEIEDHVAFLITVPTALAIFFAIFILVCLEPVFKKLLRVFSLVVWVCLVAMGYLFMCFGGIICPWDQKPLLSAHHEKTSLPYKYLFSHFPGSWPALIHVFSGVCTEF